MIGWFEGRVVGGWGGDFEPIRGGDKQTDQSQGSPSPGAVFVSRDNPLRLQAEFASQELDPGLR